MRVAIINVLSIISLVNYALAAEQTSVFHADSLRTNLRALTRGVVRSTFEMPGFTCVDNDNGTSTSCTGNTKICDDDGACAYTELTQALDEKGGIDFFKTCNRWDPDPTGNRRDGCITDIIENDGGSCVAEFEDESGTMTTCNSCSRDCDDGIGMASMDCTNVVPNKEPYTCDLLDLSDGGPTPFAPSRAASGEDADSDPSPSAPDSGSVHRSLSAMASGLLGLVVITLL